MIFLSRGTIIAQGNFRETDKTECGDAIAEY